MGIFLNKTWDYALIFNNIEKHSFYNEFYVHLLCGFSIVLDYGEINYNLVSRIFYNVF
jgi:hypothetical protein